MGHGESVAGIANAALGVEQDEAPFAMDALIQHPDGGCRRRLSGHAAGDEIEGAPGKQQADEVLAVASAGDATQPILGAIAAADQRSIADASGVLGGDAASGGARRDTPIDVHGDGADRAVLVRVRVDRLAIRLRAGLCAVARVAVMAAISLVPLAILPVLPAGGFCANRSALLLGGDDNWADIDRVARAIALLPAGVLRGSDELARVAEGHAGRDGKLLGASAHQEDMGTFEDAAGQHDGILDALYTRDGANVKPLTIHDASIELGAAVSGEHRASASVESGIVL